MRLKFCYFLAFLAIASCQTPVGSNYEDSNQSSYNSESSVSYEYPKDFKVETDNNVYPKKDSIILNVKKIYDENKNLLLEGAIINNSSQLFTDYDLPSKYKRDFKINLPKGTINYWISFVKYADGSFDN